MADCKPPSTRCIMDITKISDEVDLIDNQLYLEIISSLIHMVATRPDICNTVTGFPQNGAKPNSFHLTKSKQVFGYLKCTINKSQIFKKSLKPPEIRGILWRRLCSFKSPKRCEWILFKTTKWFHENQKSKMQLLCQHA